MRTVPHHPKTNIVIRIVVPVPISNATIRLIVIVPRPAANYPTRSIFTQPPYMVKIKKNSTAAR